MLNKLDTFLYLFHIYFYLSIQILGFKFKPTSFFYDNKLKTQHYYYIKIESILTLFFISIFNYLYFSSSTRFELVPT